MTRTQRSDLSSAADRTRQAPSSWERVPRTRSRWLRWGKPLGMWSGGKGPYLQRARSLKSIQGAWHDIIEVDQLLRRDCKDAADLMVIKFFRSRAGPRPERRRAGRV